MKEKYRQADEFYRNFHQNLNNTTASHYLFCLVDLLTMTFTRFRCHT